MSRLAPAAHRTTRCVVAVAAATTLLVAGALPASAQTVDGQDVAGAAAGTALTLTVNLPGGAATKLLLVLDPVSGTVSRIDATDTVAATSSGEVISGSIGGQVMGSGASTAALPAPLSSSSDPAAAFNDALGGTPLANLLKIQLLPSAAEVTDAPSSTSEAAVANIGVGLPDEFAGALSPLTDALSDGIDQLLTTLAEQAGTPVAALCDGLTEAVTQLEAVTGPLEEALAALPITVPVQALLDETALGAVCGLPNTLLALNVALQDALASLTGPSGVLGTGLINSSQSITTVDGVVTSTATSSIAGLTVLGQNAVVGADVLRTTSTASTAGTPGSGSASIDSTVADVTAGLLDPFAAVRTNINGIRDSFVGEGVLPAELEVVFDELFDTLNAALAPIGVVLFKADESPLALPLVGCPTALTGMQTATFVDPAGLCAAAATRGVGLSVTLPAALAGPLMIEGPLVELLIVPTAAVAGTQVLPDVPIISPPDVQLPRTGMDSGILAGVGTMLVLGTALLRRRRLALWA